MTETELFEPLIPPEVDMTGYPFTPLFRARLFGSEFHATASAEEWRAGVILWLKAWDQQPAGTLPQKDALLAKLAELSLEDWAAVRDMALHGWYPCTDGRLHHAVVAEGVLEAWGSRRSKSENGAKGAAKRWGKKAKTKNSNPNGPAIAPPLGSQWPRHSKGDEGKGHEGKDISEDKSSGAGAPKAASTPQPVGNTPTPPSGVIAPSPDHSTWVFNEGLRWLAAQAKKNPNTLRGLIGKWRRSLHDDDAKLRAIFEQAISANPIEPVAWMERAVDTRAKQNGHAEPLPDPDALSAEDLLLAKVFGGIATDTLLYRTKKLWPGFLHGAKPDEAGCKADPVVLSRHGYADPAIYARWHEQYPA